MRCQLAYCKPGAGDTLGIQATTLRCFPRPTLFFCPPVHFPSLSPDLRGTSDRPPVTSPELRACLDISDILGKILAQVEPRPELRLIGEDPGYSKAFPPPVYPVHAPEIPAVSHQHVPMRYAPPLLHFHHGDPIWLLFYSIEPVIEKRPGELMQSPVSVRPAWPGPVWSLAPLLFVRVPEG
ncbi:hypothetical protein ES703_74501 [subsurface metagenome]